MGSLGIKQKAINFRNQGYSYSYISEKLSVPKSTLSDWLSELPFKPNAETIKRIGNGKLKSALFKNRQKLKSINRATLEARNDIGKLTKRDLLMLGIGLYIGEGSKTNGTIRIVNSNPRIISFSIQWFKKICGMNINNFSLAIHLYPDHDIRKSLLFWSKITKIPLNNFGKTQVDGRKGKKINKRGILPYGTAHLTIKSNGNPLFGKFLFRKIMAWIDIAMIQAGLV